MWTPLKLQISTCRNVPVQDGSWTVICTDSGLFSDEQNRFMSTWRKHEIPLSLMRSFFNCKLQVSSNVIEEDKFLSSLIFSGSQAVYLFNGEHQMPLFQLLK